MTILTERDVADYIKLRSAREVWIEACYSGADAMDGKCSPGPAVASRDVAAASVIEAALQKARDEERAAVVAWLRNRFEETGGDFEYSAFPEAADVFERGEHRREG